MTIRTVIKTLETALREKILSGERTETVRIPMSTVVMLLVWLPKVADLIETIEGTEDK